MEKIRLSNTLKKIGNYSFHNLSYRVRYLLIPKSVQEIEQLAFSRRWNLENNKIGFSIYFEHKELAEINSIKLANRWCNRIYSYETNFYGKTPPPIRMIVKNNNMKNVVDGSNTENLYTVMVNDFTAIPIDGDGPTEWP